MSVKVTIGYNHFIYNGSDIQKLWDVLGGLQEDDGSPVNAEISHIDDVRSSRAEAEQYKRWWQEESTKRVELEARMNKALEVQDA